MSAALARMSVALRHRGPDGQGTFVSSHGHCHLIHTRLSILDLSPAGDQPMHSADGRLTLVFNGEIYNYLELRAALEAGGASFRSNSDTEVLLEMYRVHGRRFASSLRGMFAFAIWDNLERVCLLARDPLGIKPLYVAVSSDRLVFASELRAITASGLVRTELDQAGVSEFFQSGSVPEPRTLWRDVRCLEPGVTALWKAGRMVSRRFWTLRFGSQPLSDEEAVCSTRKALLASVEHHFLSDVPVGVFLSGGLDSNALLALAHVIGRKELQTFSITIPGSRTGEGDLARRSAAHFGTIHHEWALQAGVARDLFTEYLAGMDQPSIDGLNTFAASRFAREHGIKVVLSGLGADELFGGYKSFQVIPRLLSWARAVRAMGPLCALTSVALQRSGRAPFRRLGSMLSRPASAGQAYSALRGIFTPEEAAALTKRYTGQETSLGREEEPSDDPTIADTVSRMELTRYMRNQLLRDSDVMSMAHGLELRVPFLDIPLVESVSAIPASLRLRKGKELLRRAVPEIPGWIREQPKRGFLFPFQRWIDGEWAALFRGVDSRSPVPALNWSRKWALFVFEEWIRTNGFFQ